MTDFADELREGLLIATEHLGLDIGIISRIDGDAYVVEHVYDPHDGVKPGQVFPLGQTYCAITFGADDIVTVDEMGVSEHRGHPCYATFGLESYVGIPLRVAGARRGTLNFSSARPRPTAYGKAERGMVRLLARWVESRLEQVRLAQDKQRVESRMGSLFDGAPDGILLHRNGVILEVNRALAEMVGFPDRSELVGRRLLEFIPVPHHREASIERLGRLARGEAPGEPQQLQISRRDGTLVWVESRGVPVESEGPGVALTVVRDLGPRDELQGLLQTQRLAGIGAMASGVAHDLKNPLMSLSFNLQNAVELAAELPRSPLIPEVQELRESLDEAQIAGEHMEGIVRTLLGYARRGGTRQLHDVHALLGAAVRITRHDLLRRARLVEHYCEAPPVLADGPRMTQVFVNLIANACQAFDEDDPRRNEVCIETSVSPGGGLEVVVSDSGPGIPEELQPRIFERFFTTKPAGEGTGLGLTLCREVVDEHGGSLSVANRPEGGAAFTVRLPPVPRPGGGVTLPS